MEFNFDPTFTIYQIISGALGISGFILSLIQFILRQHEKYRNIDFCITGAKQHVHLFLLSYWAENKSSRLTSITDVQLLFDNKAYDIQYSPVIAQTDPNSSEGLPQTYGESPDKIPVLLNSYVAHGGCLAFKIPYEIAKNIEKPTLVISTSAGKPIKYTFSLNKTVSIKRGVKPINFS